MSLQLVQQVKADLEARGVDLSGPCGAFAIVKRVAWALEFDGWGLHGGKRKPQNGCYPHGDDQEGYSVDCLIKPNGEYIDILGDAGGANTPLWGDVKQGDAAFYRAAIDPGDPAPDPEPEPQPDPVDLGPVLAELQALRGEVDYIRRMQAQHMADTAHYLGVILEYVNKPHPNQVLGLPGWLGGNRPIRTE